VEIEVIATTGDKMVDLPLAQAGSKAIFTKEIEDALTAGRVDVAVHSLKDLPTELAPQFEIAAIPKREDARDALCSILYGSLEQLPRGARVGTSSLRRQAQLRLARPDLSIRPLRGNVDTRLRKMEAGEYDAIVLAAAGLNRLGRTDAIRQFLPRSILCPAAGQGALAVEIRAGDRATQREVEFLDDAQARATTSCERAMLHRMGGGCQVPIGASAACHPGGLRLEGVIAHPQGAKLVRASEEGEDPILLGERLGERLLREGGEEILAHISAELKGQPAEEPQWP
jgi:hydroxymethylbilane synthase